MSIPKCHSFDDRLRIEPHSQHTFTFFGHHFEILPLGKDEGPDREVEFDFKIKGKVVSGRNGIPWKISKLAANLLRLIGCQFLRINSETCIHYCNFYLVDCVNPNL